VSVIREYIYIYNERESERERERKAGRDGERDTRASSRAVSALMSWLATEASITSLPLRAFSWRSCHAQREMRVATHSHLEATSH
jgi:hypothetical protein